MPLSELLVLGSFWSQRTKPGMICIISMYVPVKVTGILFCMCQPLSIHTVWVKINSLLCIANINWVTDVRKIYHNKWRHSKEPKIYKAGAREGKTHWPDSAFFALAWLLKQPEQSSLYDYHILLPTVFFLLHESSPYFSSPPPLLSEQLPALLLSQPLKQIRHN